MHVPVCVCVFVCVCLCACMHMPVCWCVSLYLCVSVCLSVCLCVCLYVSVCLSLHVCVHVYLSVCVCLCVSVCMYLCVCVCMSICVHLCVSEYVYMCVCVYMSNCVDPCICAWVWVSVCVYLCVCLRECARAHAYPHAGSRPPTPWGACLQALPPPTGATSSPSPCYYLWFERVPWPLFSYSPQPEDCHLLLIYYLGKSPFLSFFYPFLPRGPTHTKQLWLPLSTDNSKINTSNFIFISKLSSSHTLYVFFLRDIVRYFKSNMLKMELAFFFLKMSLISFICHLPYSTHSKLCQPNLRFVPKLPQLLILGHYQTTSQEDKSL